MKTKTYTEASSSCRQLRCRGAWQRMSLALLLLMLTTMTAWAADVSLQQDGSEWYVNMPQTGSNTLTLTDASITTFKVYDDGGKSGEYSNNCNGNLVLKAPDGYVFQLSGNIRTGGTYDNLTVYDNSAASGTKLIDAVYSPAPDYNNIAIKTVTSTGRDLTLNFTTNFLSTYAGLNLTVTLVSTSTEYDVTVDNSSATGGTATANTTSAKVNETVTLTATPESGYLFSGISVTDANNNAVVGAGGWYSNNQATFTMPGSAVTVTPTFTNDLANLSVNMPTTGEKDVIIPSGVQSFKVYDDGGVSGDYSQNCDGTLVLTAPTGYVLQLSGSIKTETSYWGENLTVYNGADNTATTLINEVSSPTAGETLAIGPVISTGNVMTVYFHTGASYTEAGLDLIVTVVNPNASYAINVLGSVTGGSIAASVGGVSATTAEMNDEVTLTATPESGYMLSGISVTDANSDAVAVTWDGPFYNTATFTMPASAATVTPTFTNDLTADNGLYVNMPTTDSKSITIPSGVQSFKVYDDGGVSANYSNYYEGTLVLTAPDGFVLQLSGGITAESSDKLTVYDGATNTATKLIDAVGGSASTKKDITTVTSTGTSMTIYFKSDYSMVYAGLDLTVTLIPVLSETTGITDAASLKGRTAQFSRTFSAGVASTLCLPFPMTTIPGGKAYEFGGVTYDATANSGAGAWMATMNEVSATVANTPYLYKADADADIVFSGTVASDFDGNAGTSTSGDWTFKGTYLRLTYSTDPFSGYVYGFASTPKNVEGVDVAAGEFIMATSGASVPPMRCYLTYKDGQEYTAARGLTRGAAIQIPDRITVRLVGKDGDINGIGTLTLSTGEFTTEGWYSLNGRKLDGKPTKKGLYINNGRKVVIK